MLVVLPVIFPCSILAGIFCGFSLCIMLYQYCCENNPRVLLFPLLSAAVALPEFVSTLLSSGFYFLRKYIIFLKGPIYWDIFLYIFIICLLTTLVLSMAALIMQVRLLSSDSVYAKWTKHSSWLQKAYQYTVNLLSIFNFKLAHCLWSGIRSLPLLEPSKKLSFFHKPSGFSVFVSLAFTANSAVLYLFRP